MPPRGPPLRRPLEENRDAALADIDGNILARSSQAPFQSRVRPGPRNHGRSRRRSCAWSRHPFGAAVTAPSKITLTRRRRTRNTSWAPLLRKAMRRYTRAVTRGLPGARLKAIFPFDLLAKLAAVLEPAHLEPWSPWNSAHAVDAMILAVWFMLREIEFAAARTQDIDVLPGAVVLRIPLHKVATRRGDRAHRAAAPVRVPGVGTATVPLPCRPAPRRSAQGGWRLGPGETALSRRCRPNVGQRRGGTLLPEGAPGGGRDADHDGPYRRRGADLCSAPLPRRRRGLAGGPRATYQTPGKKRHTQIPVILELLRRVGYPDMPGITDDLTNGFVMLGEVRRAPGWRTRTDGRYSNPASLEQLAATNWAYVKARTSRLAAGTHTDTLLAELVEETRLGRVVGPTRAPPGWNLHTTAVLDRPGVDTLVPPPPGQHFAAASFPIVQTDEAGNDKIRRGEDWRRSGHNSTIRAHDVPTHHFVDDYVDMIRRLVEIVGVPAVAAIRIFGHDLMNAYRQWPVRDPAHSGTFLAGPHGVTMWFHMAMCFGAAASVWNLNRTADALQALKRVLLWIVSGHFVDDFNGVDIEDLADGAFHGMAEFFELLGLQTKPSKAQAPATAHVVQGVLVSIGEEGVVLKPTPERVKKVTATIDEALRTDEMTPEVAGKLAGRLNFITQATFGALGKAALKPVYSRAHDAAASTSTGLSAGLRAALMALEALLANIQPRVIPYIDDGEPQAIIYADAFYQPGETRYKAGHFPAEVPVNPDRKDPTAGASWCASARRCSTTVARPQRTSSTSSRPGAPSSTSLRFWRRCWRW